MRPSVFGITLLFVAVAAGCTSQQSTPAAAPPSAPGSDIDRAVAMANSAVRQRNLRLEEYTLTSVQRMVLQGKILWHVTLKPTNLLPPPDGSRPGGLGGEIFVNVDLAAQETQVRYGE